MNTEYKLITKALNLQGFFVKAIVMREEKGGIVEIFLEREEARYLCPRCSQYTFLSNGRRKRKVRHLDLFSYPVYLVFLHYEVRCICGFRGMEHLGFVDKMRRTTKFFEADFYRYCKHVDIKNLSRLKGVDKSTGYNIDKRYIEQELESRRLKYIEVLHADEISLRKGHDYITILSSPGDPGKVIDVSHNRQYISLVEILNDLGDEVLKNVKAFCIDMWNPYVKAIKMKCPQALIVYDKFHILKNLNDALDEVRRIQQRKAMGSLKKVFKGKRWLLLRKGTRLKLDQKRELQLLWQLNKPIATGYVLKEDFYRFFQYKRIGWARRFYQRWRERVLYSNLQPLIDFVKMMDRRIDYIYNYFRFRINNGFLEGLNNKIKTIKKMAYGYNDWQYFRLKILQQCGRLN